MSLLLPFPGLGGSTESLLHVLGRDLHVEVLEISDHGLIWRKKKLLFCAGQAESRRKLDFHRQPWLCAEVQEVAQQEGRGKRLLETWQVRIWPFQVS